MRAADEETVKAKTEAEVLSLMFLDLAVPEV